MQEGLTDDHIEALDRYAESDVYSPREKLALTYAERITLSDQDVDEGLFAEIEAEFGSPEAIVELTAIIAYENHRSKFNHALLIESNGFCLVKQTAETTAGPDR